MRTALAAPGACRRPNSDGRWTVGIDRDARPDEMIHGGIEHQSNQRKSDEADLNDGGGKLERQEIHARSWV